MSESGNIVVDTAARLFADLYREAFARMVEDPEFIERGRTLADNLMPMSSRDVDHWMKSLAASSPQALQFIAAMLRRQGVKID